LRREQNLYPLVLAWQIRKNAEILTKGLSNHPSSILKKEDSDHHQEDNKAPSHGGLNYQFHPLPIYKEDDSSANMMSMMSLMDHEHMNEMDHFNSAESFLRTPRPKSSYARKHSGFNFLDAGTEHNGDNNHMNFSNEFNSFNDLMSAFQSKPFPTGEAYHEPSAFLNPRGFTPVYPRKDSVGRGENIFTFEENGDNSQLRSYLDTQNLLHRAFRKASMMSYNGNPSYRKNSFDMFS